MNQRRLNEKIRMAYEMRRARRDAAILEANDMLMHRFPRLKSCEQELNLRILEQADLALKEGPAAMQGVRWKDLSREIQRLSRERERILAAAEHEGHDLTDGTSCPVCADYGYVDGKPCPVCYKAVLSAILADDMERNFRGASFEAFRTDLYPEQSDDPMQPSPRNLIQNLLKAMQEYVENFARNGAAGQPSMLFVGKPGTGKSFMAACIGRALLERGYHVEMLGMPECLRHMQEYEKLRNSFRPDPERLDEIGSLIRRIQSCDLLILDDLGTESEQSRRRNDFLQILSERERSAKPLLISSNIGIKELNRIYDERIVSRLLGAFRVYRFVGEDLRLRLRNERLRREGTDERKQGNKP